MDKTKEPGPPNPAPVRKPDRLAKEADALRANLRKRKDQARLRAEQSVDPAQSVDRADPPGITLIDPHPRPAG